MPEKREGFMTADGWVALATPLHLFPVRVLPPRCARRLRRDGLV